jgi:hypothetical protein
LTFLWPEAKTVYTPGEVQHGRRTTSAQVFALLLQSKTILLPGEAGNSPKDTRQNSATTGCIYLQGEEGLTCTKTRSKSLQVKPSLPPVLIKEVLLKNKVAKAHWKIPKAQQQWNPIPLQTGLIQLLTLTSLAYSFLGININRDNFYCSFYIQHLIPNQNLRSIKKARKYNPLSRIKHSRSPDANTAHLLKLSYRAFEITMTDIHTKWLSWQHHKMLVIPAKK